MKAVVDAFLINVSFLAAYHMRFRVLDFLAPAGLTRLENYSGTLIFITVLWLAMFKLMGLYDRKRSDIIDEGALLFMSVTFSSLLLFGMLFIYRGFWFSRLLILNAWGIAFILLFLYRVSLLLLQRILLSRGIGIKNVLIVGAGEIGQTLALRLMSNKGLAGRPVVFLDDDPEKIGKSFHGVLVIGEVDRLKAMMKEYCIGEVVFATSRMPYQRMLDLITECETAGVSFKIVPGILEIIASRIDVDEVGGVPLITISEIGLKGFNSFVKRTFDIVFSGILVIVLVPLFLLVALLIKLGSRGPVFFAQPRVGKDGKLFPMLKFRSMVLNAEELFDELKERSEVEGHVFKMKDDPRLTRVGRVIRRLSIDELPQVLNVFLGHMSIVGPRPPIPREVQNYSAWHKKRLRVAPGITGLWQVSGRSLLPFEDMVRLDIYYIENWSLWMDIKILFRTVPVVLTAHGAF